MTDGALRRLALRGVLLVELLAVLLPLPAQADECKDIVCMDGLFSQARRMCPFSYYAFRFQQQSQMCRDKQGAQEWQRLFSTGTAAFDAQAAKRGRRTLCDKLAQDFPMTVKY